MPYYVSRYVGSGTLRDPWKPAIWGSAFARCIDLRPDATQGNGVAFCDCDLDISGPGFQKIADAKIEKLSALVNRRLYQELLVSERPIGTVLQDTIRDLLVNPPRGAWKPLTRARGVLEIWMGGRLFWADGTPLPPLGGTINDSFTRADEAPVAAPWIELAGSTGQVDLVSNALTRPDAGDLFLYHNNNGGGWNADQSAKWTMATSIPNNDWGAAVRIGSSGFSGYFYTPFSAGSVLKFVAGSITGVETSSSGGGMSAGQTRKIDVQGSTIRYYNNADAEDANSPVTDTSLSTAGNGAGCFIFESGGSLDDAVLTGEISAAAGVQMARPVADVLPMRRYMY